MKWYRWVRRIESRRRGSKGRGRRRGIWCCSSNLISKEHEVLAGPVWMSRARRAYFKIPSHSSYEPNRVHPSVYKQWIGIAIGLFPPLPLQGLSFHPTLSHIKKDIFEPSSPLLNINCNWAWNTPFPLHHLYRSLHPLAMRYVNTFRNR